MYIYTLQLLNHFVFFFSVYLFQPLPLSAQKIKVTNTQFHPLDQINGFLHLYKNHGFPLTI